MGYSIDGRRIVITGASRGIGAALARAAAPRARELVLVARSGSDLAALAAALPCPSQLRVCDLTQPDELATLAGELARDAPDVLVNNAGAGRWGPFSELPLVHLDAMCALNMRALAALSRSVLPGMVARGRGAIMNVGSTAGFQGTPFMAAYGGTKAFVNGFTEGLAWELRGTGVTVTCVVPGSTRTDFFRAGEIPADLMLKLMQSPDAVAREAWRALEHGQPCRVTGLANRVLFGLGRFMPRWLIGKIAYRVLTPARPPGTPGPDTPPPGDGCR